MATMTNISITLPPKMLESAQKIAKAENRTMSELVREALRSYEKQRLQSIIEENRKEAEKLGITEADVVRIVREFRAEKRKGKNKLSKG